MSEQTFQSFMQRRKHGAAQREKTAAGNLGRPFQAAGDAMGDLIKQILYKEKDVTPEVLEAAKMRYVPKSTTERVMVGTGPQAKAETIDVPGPAWANLPDPEKRREYESAAGMMEGAPQFKYKPGPEEGQVIPSFVRQEFSPGRALAATGIGVGGLALADAAAEPVEQALQSAAFPGFGPAQRKQRAMEQFAGEGGKQVAKVLGDLTTSLGTTGYQAARALPQAALQQQQFAQAIKSDSLLSAATAGEKRVLARAFNSMVRFAPELATDEFAVKNFLREALMSASGGPDYSTLSSLARASQAIQGDQR